MPRPQLPIGTWGKIRRQQLGPKRWRARARFRDYDGVTRDVEAHDETGPKAENKLRTMLRDRSTPNNNTITGDTKIRKLAELWLEEITGQGRITPQTIERYTACLRQAVDPGTGALTVREATVGRLDQFFKKLASEHPAQARNAKTVLSQMLGMAVRHGAIPTNPIRDIAALPQYSKTVVALTPDQIAAVRAAVHSWQQHRPGQSGPRHTEDLADIVELLLGTGVRIGEVLAIRWCDINLQGNEPQLTISGTLVYLKGKGLFRQSWPKTEAGYRTITLPRFAVDILRRRQKNRIPNDLDAVFHTRNQTWHAPNNIRRQLRSALNGTELEWVVPHTFRKTVATHLDREGERDAATLHLGHSSADVTKTYYIEKAIKAPDVSGVLQTLGDPVR